MFPDPALCLLMPLLSSAAPPLPQSIEPTPPQAEVGTTVVIEARSREGRPIEGLHIDVRRPDDADASLGPTDAEGRVAFVPDQPGTYRLIAEHRGVRLIAPFHAVPARRRWLWGAPLALLGIVLIWRNFLGLRRDRRAGSRDGATDGADAESVRR